MTADLGGGGGGDNSDTVGLIGCQVRFKSTYTQLYQIKCVSDYQQA